MTRQEFIELHRHQIGGLVLDAATAGRHGAELSQWLKLAMRKIDEMLSRAWADVHGEPARHAEPRPAQANGNLRVAPHARQGT